MWAILFRTSTYLLANGSEGWSECTYLNMTDIKQSFQHAKEHKYRGVPDFYQFSNTWYNGKSDTFVVKSKADAFFVSSLSSQISILWKAKWISPSLWTHLWPTPKFALNVLLELALDDYVHIIFGLSWHSHGWIVFTPVGYIVNFWQKLTTNLPVMSG